MNLSYRSLNGLGPADVLLLNGIINNRSILQVWSADAFGVQLLRDVFHQVGEHVSRDELLLSGVPVHAVRVIFPHAQCKEVRCLLQIANSAKFLGSIVRFECIILALVFVFVPIRLNFNYTCATYVNVEPIGQVMLKWVLAFGDLLAHLKLWILHDPSQVRPLDLVICAIDPHHLHALRK